MKLPLRSAAAILALAPLAWANTAAATSAETLVVADAALEGELIDTIVVRGERIERVLPDAVGARIFAGKKTTNTNLDELPPLATGQLREAFALTPGLLVSEASNRSWASINYRGLGEPHESWNILILKDGVAVSPDPYNYPAAYYTPPLDAVSRIEFVRGGSSLLYGPQPGGTLNYVTRTPAHGETGFAASAAFGSGAFANLYASSWTGDLDWGVHGYVSRVEGEGPRSVNSDFKMLSAAATLTRDVGPARFHIGLDVYRGDFGEPGGLSLARFIANPSDASTPLDAVKIDRIVAQAGVEADFGDWFLQGRINANYYDRASRRQLGGSFGQPTPAANVALVQSQKFRNLTLDLRLRHSFAGWSEENVLTVGTTLFGSSAPVTVDKGISPTDWTGAAGAVARTERNATVAAYFAEAALNFGNWTITPGVRIEALDQKVREHLELSSGSSTGGGPGAPIGPLDARNNDEWIVLPGLGVSYDISPDHEAYANLSRGFKPVLFNDGLTFQAGVNPAAVFETGYSLSAEAGLRGGFSGVLSYDVSAFFVRLENQVGFLAGPLPASGAFGAVGVGGARRQTVGTMENQGVDIAAEVSLTRLFGQTSDTEVLAFANASLLNAEFVDGAAKGGRPQYAPEQFLRAGLIARFGGQGKLAITGTYLSEHAGADNAAAEFRIPAYAVFDLTGEVAVSDQTSLFAAVNNVFDRSYISRIRPGGGQGIDPGAPRTMTVGLKLKY
jgi:Fe(3+) dicitrate transport protein